VGDARSPGLPPASLDVVAASLVLFFLPDPASALRAWCEVLVPGGRLGIATFGPAGHLLSSVDELFVPHLPPAMLDARTSGRRGPFASDAGVEALFSEAGLADVRTVHLALRTVLTGPEQWREFSWSHGQRGLWGAVPPEHHRQPADVVALIEAARKTDGTVVLHQDVRYTLGGIQSAGGR
jgi:SAM-dependent methyltransferase